MRAKNQLNAVREYGADAAETLNWYRSNLGWGTGCPLIRAQNFGITFIDYLKYTEQMLPYEMERCQDARPRRNKR